MVAATSAVQPPTSNGGETSDHVSAEEVGADLLIKSAYTQSRARQFIFGGGTGHVLMEAHIRVLMAH